MAKRARSRRRLTATRPKRPPYELRAASASSSAGFVLRRAGLRRRLHERLLDAVHEDLGACELFLVGSRGLGLAAERNIVASWSCAMPSHSPGIPMLADRVSEALYARIAQGEIGQLDVVFSEWEARHGIGMTRRRLIRSIYPPFLGPWTGIRLF
jgi:F-type H+-transporting ATPase subunit gamma